MVLMKQLSTADIGIDEVATEGFGIDEVALYCLILCIAVYYCYYFKIPNSNQSVRARYFIDTKTSSYYIWLLQIHISNKYSINTFLI